MAHGIQTGLILAGGVNAADHAETLGVFAQSLRAQGHTVATLRSSDVRKDGAASAAALGDLLRCMLAQLTGDEVADAVDMRPLEAWHATHGGDKPVVSGLEWRAVRPPSHLHVYVSETARDSRDGDCLASLPAAAPRPSRTMHDDSPHRIVTWPSQ
jgi:hypothetical protein